MAMWTTKRRSGGLELFRFARLRLPSLAELSLSQSLRHPQQLV